MRRGIHDHIFATHGPRTSSHSKSKVETLGCRSLLESIPTSNVPLDQFDLNLRVHVEEQLMVLWCPAFTFVLRMLYEDSSESTGPYKSKLRVNLLDEGSTTSSQTW